MNWVHIATVPGQIEAEMCRDMLLSAGISAMIGQGDTSTFLGISSNPIRIMVDEDEHEKARDVLDQLRKLD